MGFFKGSKATPGYYTRDDYGAWNPEQKTLNKGLSGVLNTAMAGELPQYSGEFAAPLSEYEQQIQDNNARLNAMSGSWADKFQPGVIDPEVDKTEWDKYNKAFYGDGLQPGAKALAEEQFAGTGGYWGDARAKGVIDTYGRTVTDPYNQFRSNALQNSYTNALNYGKTMSDLNVAGAEIAGIPRGVAQMGLDKEYAEWIRTRPENKDYVDAALNFLQLSSVTNTYTPGTAMKKSGFQQIAGNLGWGTSAIADAVSGTGDYSNTGDAIARDKEAILKLLKLGG